jgi:hypothetical protein
MKPKRKGATLRSLLVMLCTFAIVPGNTLAYSQTSQPARTPSSDQVAKSGDQAAKIPPDQLDSLVAPIALYPDPLLAQTLAASTYPLEIIQLQQWLAKNPKLKDKELADAVAKQPWDPSVQAMAALPDVVKRLADDIQWTTDLGNAFLAQQSDVMDAVQRMRKKAQDKGNLKSSEQQKVETKVVETKSVIVVEQANPQVVYVPSYNPTVVYGAPVYAYPPIYYPPPGYYAAGMAISFGVGVAMGAMWSGGWGWGAGWGSNNVQINNYNNFNRNANVSGTRGAYGGTRNVTGGTTNVTGGTRNVQGGNTTWNHNPQHRGGAPYRDQATAERFGGTARGESLANRQEGARQQVREQGGNLRSNREGEAGAGNRTGGDRTAGGGNRTAGDRNLGGDRTAGDRNLGGDRAAGDRNLGGDRAAGGAGAGNRPSGSDRVSGAAGNRPGGGGADSIGSRDLSRSGGGNRDAFGGGSRGYNGASARASSSRGSSSMGSRGGGGRGGGRRR